MYTTLGLNSIPEIDMESAHSIRLDIENLLRAAAYEQARLEKIEEEQRKILEQKVLKKKEVNGAKERVRHIYANWLPKLGEGWPGAELQMDEDTEINTETEAQAQIAFLRAKLDTMPDCSGAEMERAEKKAQLEALDEELERARKRREACENEYKKRQEAVLEVLHREVDDVSVIFNEMLGRFGASGHIELVCASTGSPVSGESSWGV